MGTQCASPGTWQLVEAVRGLLWLLVVGTGVEVWPAVSGSLVRLNGFLDFPQRKAGFVFPRSAGWQWPCVLSEAQATNNVGQTVFALHAWLWPRIHSFV